MNSRTGAILAVLLLAVSVGSALFPSGSAALNDLLPVACVLLAAVGLAAAASGFSRAEPAGKAWRLLLAGVLLFALGEMTYGILEVGLGVDVENAFPTLADLFWMAGYPPAILGLMILLREYRRGGLPLPRRTLLAGLGIGCLAIGAAIVTFVFLPILADEETGSLAKAAYLFYPIGDLFLIVPSLLLASITSLYGGGRVSLPWRAIAAGFLFMSLADIGYSLVSWAGLYSGGGVLDIAWNFGYLALAMGGFSQRDLSKLKGGAEG
jgi:hypothetical protein